MKEANNNAKRVPAPGHHHWQILEVGQTLGQHHGQSQLLCARKSQRPHWSEPKLPQTEDKTKKLSKRWLERVSLLWQIYWLELPTWSWGTSCLSRNSTNFGTTPALITSSIGGQRSMQEWNQNQKKCYKTRRIHQVHSYIPIDKSFLNWVVASNWMPGSADATPCTIKGILSNCYTTARWNSWYTMMCHQ